MTVEQIAKLVNGTAEGDGTRVLSGANTFEQASSWQLAFVDNPKAFAAASSSQAGCLLVPEAFEGTGSWSLVRSANPRLAFASALRHLYPARVREPGIHPTAIIDPSAKIAPNCTIEAFVTVGADASFNTGCYIAAGCRIGSFVTIGSDTTLHPNVTLYDGITIGNRVILHAGCVVGADGFGYSVVNGYYEKFPQVGSVVIEDDVELGANCTIDRAALGVTRIGAGTKLDNLVHVAHNCTLGKHVVVAAQTGFSGSVTVGDYAMIGGQAGIGEKALIDGKAVVGGKAGILTSQHIKAGEPVWGIPARPLKQHLRNLANVSRLEKLKSRVDALEKLNAGKLSKESDLPAEP